MVHVKNLQVINNYWGTLILIIWFNKQCLHANQTKTTTNICPESLVDKTGRQHCQLTDVHGSKFWHHYVNRRLIRLATAGFLQGTVASQGMAYGQCSLL